MLWIPYPHLKRLQILAETDAPVEVQESSTGRESGLIKVYPVRAACKRTEDTRLVLAVRRIARTTGAHFGKIYAKNRVENRKTKGAVPVQRGS